MHRQTSSIWGLHPLARRETRRTLGPGQRIDTHSLSKCVSTCAHHRFVSECVSGEASEVPVASGRRPPGCTQHRSLAVSVNRSSRQLGKHDLQFTDTDKERWFGRGRRLSSRPKSRASDADAPELLRSNCHACRTIRSVRRRRGHNGQESGDMRSSAAEWWGPPAQGGDSKSGNRSLSE